MNTPVYSQLNHRIAMAVATVLFILLAVFAISTNEIDDPNLKYAIASGATAAVPVMLFMLARTVEFGTRMFRTTNALLPIKGPQLQYSDLESVHVHHTIIRAADKSPALVIKLNMKGGKVVKAVFRTDDQAIAALSLLKQSGARFAVGYSKSSREASFVLRKAGFIS
jgi:hypothetical protein